MKLRLVGECLVGGSIVYVAMAACASSTPQRSSHGSASQVATTGPTTATGASGAGGATSTSVPTGAQNLRLRPQGEVP